MQMMVNHNTLTKALDTPNSRIVLGTGVYGFAYVMLGLWVAGVAGIVLFFGSAMAPMPGAGARDLTLPIGMLTGAVAWVYLLGGSKSRLILDCIDHTYLHEFGLPPLMKRRRSHLDTFSHLSLTRQMETHGGNCTRYAVWKLALVPKAEPPATECTTDPIVITFVWWGDQSATVAVALSQRLADRVALPLRDESQEVAPERKTPARAGWGCLLLVVGLIGLSNAYTWYVCRGIRFPVRPGTPLLINHQMGAYTVRSLEVTAGPSHSEGGGLGSYDDHGSQSYVVTPYSITLDIENTGSKPSTLNFAIGFDARARTDGSSGPLQPHTHRRVTVDVVKIGNPPDDLFFR